LRRAIDKTCGNLTDAAMLLGISRSTVYSKVKKYGIQL
jgi:transcriptional regulator of acetoin/glycerol metabolism